MDARCGTVAAQADQPFDAECDPERGQRSLTVPMDEVLCSVERCAAAAGSGEIDPNLDGGGLAAPPARGRADREVDPDVRCAGRQGQARHVENRDALAG
ncbi:hypothetical protein ACFTS5_09345 [Nocardia sp. NPDC056952]|uniref:hypothetical protein n=1 Tax=Nocardia sp. NPDC056952 TaxID=3345979 RepID=UPI00363AFC6F